MYTIRHEKGTASDLTRPITIETVKIERRATTLRQLIKRHVLTKSDLRTISRKVVIHKLPEIGEAGRNMPVRDRIGACHHFFECDKKGIAIARRCSRNKLREAKVACHLRWGRYTLDIPDDPSAIGKEEMVSGVSL
jgi:hypothetical protein